MQKIDSNRITDCRSSSKIWHLLDLRLTIRQALLNDGKSFLIFGKGHQTYATDKWE